MMNSMVKIEFKRQTDAPALSFVIIFFRLCNLLATMNNNIYIISILCK